AVLQTLLKDNDVYTQEAFIFKTIMYWTMQSGIGIAFFLTAVLGLAVGGAIVGQTIYASTIEHLKEFGTLKAMGARNGELSTIIMGEASLSAVLGYGCGAAILSLAKESLEAMGMPLYLHGDVFIALFVAILATCVVSAYISVRRVRTVDPLLVFKE